MGSLLVETKKQRTHVFLMKTKVELININLTLN